MQTTGIHALSCASAVVAVNFIEFLGDVLPKGLQSSKKLTTLSRVVDLIELLPGSLDGLKTLRDRSGHTPNGKADTARPRQDRECDLVYEERDDVGHLFYLFYPRSQILTFPSPLYPTSRLVMPATGEGLPRHKNPPAATSREVPPFKERVIGEGMSSVAS